MTPVIASIKYAPNDQFSVPIPSWSSHPFIVYTWLYLVSIPDLIFNLFRLLNSTVCIDYNIIPINMRVYFYCSNSFATLKNENNSTLRTKNYITMVWPKKEKKKLHNLDTYSPFSPKEHKVKKGIAPQKTRIQLLSKYFGGLKFTTAFSSNCHYQGTPQPPPQEPNRVLQSYMLDRKQNNHDKIFHWSQNTFVKLSR